MPGSPALVAFFLFMVMGTLLAMLRIMRKSAPAMIYVAPAWLAFTAVLAGSGVLAFGAMPPRAPILIGLATLATTAIAWSKIGARISAEVPLAALIGYQAFRIPVELFLDWGYHDGIVPVQMTLEGRNFDILSGITACVAAFLALRGKLSKPLAVAWNVFGLALLANIVAVAVLSMPTPIRAFMNDPPNTFVAEAPYIWLPVFLVQAALFGHFLVFRKVLGVQGTSLN